MEELLTLRSNSQNNEAIKRFNDHSIACMELVGKMQKEFFKRLNGQSETIHKYLQLFGDTKDSFKVLSLVIEEIESDLSLADLNFICYPYRKILTFYGNLSNAVLDAFADVYGQLRKYQEKEKLAGDRDPDACLESRKVNCVLVDEAEQVRQRKEQFAQREKINYLIQAGLEEPDNDYMVQLNKILDSKEVWKRCRVSTTSAEMQLIKEKMEDIMHFADFISGENSRFKTQEFANIDIYRQGKQSVQQLTSSIFKSFEEIFKAKYVAAVKESGRRSAEEIQKSSLKKMVNQECQTYQFAGTKKPQMENLIKDLESKTKMISDLTANLENTQQLFQSADLERTILREEKKKNQELVRHFSQSFQTIEKEYAAYRADTEASVQEMRNVMYKKDQRLSEMNQQVEKYENVKLLPPIPKRDAETDCKPELLNKEIQTIPVVGQDQYNLSVMKEKHESLGRLNLLKEMKIKRLEGYTQKLRQQLRATFEQLSIDIDEEDLDLFIKKVSAIDRREICRRISIMAESFRVVAPPLQRTPDSEKQENSVLESVCDSRSISKLIESKFESKCKSKIEIELATVEVQTDPYRSSQKTLLDAHSKKNLVTPARNRASPLAENSSVQTDSISTQNRGINVRIQPASLECQRCATFDLQDVDHHKNMVHQSFQRNVVNIKVYPMSRPSLIRRPMRDMCCQTKPIPPQRTKTIESPTRLLEVQKHKPRPTVEGASFAFRSTIQKKIMYHHDARVHRIESFEDLPELPAIETQKHRADNSIRRPHRSTKDQFSMTLEHAKNFAAVASQEPHGIYRLLRKMRFSIEETDRITRYLQQLEKSTHKRVDVKIQAQRMIKEVASRHYVSLQECPHYSELIELLNRMI